MRLASPPPLYVPVIGPLAADVAGCAPSRRRSCPEAASLVWSSVSLWKLLMPLWIHVSSALFDFDFGRFAGLGIGESFAGFDGRTVAGEMAIQATLLGSSNERFMGGGGALGVGELGQGTGESGFVGGVERGDPIHIVDGGYDRFSGCRGVGRCGSNRRRFWRGTHGRWRGGLCWVGRASGLEAAGDEGGPWRRWR